MKHDWYDPRYQEPREPTPKTPGERFSYQWEYNYGVRKCRTCGARQVKLADHEWMRVVAYRWTPLVGRCKGQKRSHGAPRATRRPRRG